MAETYYIKTDDIRHKVSAYKFMDKLRDLKKAYGFTGNDTDENYKGFLTAEKFIESYEKLDIRDKKYFEKLSIDDYISCTEDNYNGVLSPSTMEEDIFSLLCRYMNFKIDKGEILSAVPDGRYGILIKADCDDKNLIENEIRNILKGIESQNQDIDIEFIETVPEM